MTRQRGALYVLLFLVAAAAAVLSFSALRDLALVCGFTHELAWLLPVVVDAGAAAGSIVWLAGWTPPEATRYGRALAVTLLGLSVGGNALGHGLAAFELAPAWWVVVLVSAIAPAVLGAFVHLVTLVGRPVGSQRALDHDGRVPTETPSAWDHPAPDRRPERDAAPSSPAPDGPTPDRDPTDPDRPEVDPPMTDGDIIHEAREWAVDLGRPPSRDEMLTRYRIGAGRARKLRRILGWADEPTAPDRVPTGAAS